MFIVLLNYIDVSDDVIDINTVNKEMTIGQANIAVVQSTIILNNIERKYDDDNTSSIFYASAWYNKRVTIYDTISRQTIFNGRIKGYEADEKQVKVIATNYFKDLLDTTCDYSVNNLTPAEHIYAIMTTVANIPVANIMYGSYLTAVAEQTSLGIKVNVNIEKAKNYDCLHVIQELAKIGCIDIYDNKEVIYMRQWSPYTGVGGYAISKRDIIPGNYKQQYSDANLCNDVLIAYSTGSTIAYYNASYETSIYIYGVTKTMKIPDNTNISTSISDYNIYCTDQSSAEAIATLLLQRYSYLIKTCEIELQPKYNFLQLYDIIDVYQPSGIKEPLQIIRVQNKETSVLLTCIYLNKPKQYVEITRYIEPVTIIKALSKYYNAISLFFTDINDNTLYYEIYFRPADGDWVGTDSLKGISPVKVEKTQCTILKGNYIYTIDGLHAGTEYQFKIIAYDTNGNRSTESNTYIVRTFNVFNYSYENKFNCKGNLLEGITIDVTNQAGGTLPDELNNDWILYDSCVYDSNYYSPNSVYETPLFTSENGFIFISFIVDAGTNKIKWQYRFYDPDELNNDWILYDSCVYDSNYYSPPNIFCATTINSVYGLFTNWSGLHQPADAYYFQCPEGVKGVQFRFIYYSLDWSDSDVIYLNNYQEA